MLPSRLSQPVLEDRQFRRSRPAGWRSRLERTARVDGIDLTVEPGEIFGVLGPNGAGKTTMLQMLATLLPIDQGEARVFGFDVRTQPHAVRQLIGVTGQYASVDENLTGRENLWLFGRLQGLTRKEARGTANDLLAKFELTEAADRPISEFSGGMRRRLDLAASLITQPALIFLDEPTTGLDPRTRGQMWDTIRDLVTGGATILLTTQYLDEADELADRIAVIDRGTKVAQGTPAELKARVGESTLRLQVADPTHTTRRLPSPHGSPQKRQRRIQPARVSASRCPTPIKQPTSSSHFGTKASRSPARPSTNRASTKCSWP